MSIYSPAPATAGATTLTVSRFINSPVMVYRTMRGLVEQRLVGGRVLSGRLDLTGSGSAIFEVDEDGFANDEAEVVDDLMEYPLTDTPESSLAVASTLKRGLATEVSDELIARNRMDQVRRKLLKIANRIAFGFDSIVLSAVASAVTATHAAAAAWDAAGADQFLDVMLGSAEIDELNQGYNPSVILARPTQWARLVAAAVKLGATPREGANVLYSGRLVEFAGLTFIKTTNMPPGVDVMILDPDVLGTIAYERLGGGYQGDPADPVGVESKVIRLEESDGVRIQARKVAVPMVQEPAAAIKITGV